LAAKDRRIGRLSYFWLVAFLAPPNASRFSSSGIAAPQLFAAEACFPR
jgi:hypothetical protein